MKNIRYLLWVALFSLALSGALLHLRIHPPTPEIGDIVPNLFSWIAVLVICPLFLFRSTAILGVILNTFLAYLGIILMADFSLSATLAGQVKTFPSVSFFGWLLETTFADITVLLGHLLVGLSLYKLMMMEH